jgi:carboxylesterase type B
MRLGLAVGMQIMAFGASRPVPFWQGIMESQALEPGITGTFTRDAFKAVTEAVGCNKTSLQSAETIACLRALDRDTILNASLATYQSDAAHNIGDIWLPSVDGDFLPDAPSKLIEEGRIAHVAVMIGWADDDANIFVPFTTATEQDTFNFVTSYLPGMTNATIAQLLALYPSSDFSDDSVSGLPAQFFRLARIVRDILFTCDPIWYGKALAKCGNDVYFYDQNQTVLDDFLAAANLPPLGPIHGSEISYVFAELSQFGLPYNTSQSDYALQSRESRSWSTFASLGRPSLGHHDTLQGWNTGFSANNQPQVFVIGGPEEGLSGTSGKCRSPGLCAEKLPARCAFLTQPRIIAQQQF